MRYEYNLLTKEVIELPDLPPTPIPEPTPEEIQAGILKQIDTLEREQLMPRATREFMLMFMEANASAEILAVNPGYQAVKAFDLLIAGLRSQLAPVE